MADNKSSPRAILLRATLKVLTGVAVIWLGYIFTAGFFDNSKSTEINELRFDLTSVSENSAVYFKAEQRDLLVINSSGNYFVFWANDPVYGCRLEYLNTVIKPVCIDIRYNLDGLSVNRGQELLKPGMILL